MNRTRSLVTLGACALAAALPTGAHAASVAYGFSCITNSSPTNCATGAAQIRVVVSNEGVGANQVMFTFTNTGSLASSLTDVYFDDGTLLGIASIVNGGAGVSFTQSATPPNLPGGLGIGFTTTAGFSADSTPPVAPNGVNPGESVSILFNLLSGKTFNDTIAALGVGLAQGGVTGALRIGIHVQAFGPSGSESFVNTAPVPLPAAAWLLLGALAGFGPLARRRRPVGAPLAA